MSRTPSSGIDYTSKDYEAFRAMMIDQLGITMPEYTDRSQTDAGIVIIELLAKGLDVLSFYQDSIANEALLPTAEQRSSVLKWCNILGYEPKQSTPSRVKQVFTLSSAQSEDFKIPKGTIVRTAEEINGSYVYFETEEDLTIPRGKLGDEQSESEYLYSVTAVQGLSVYSELVGSSTGVADQSFTLKYSPVLTDSVKVYVNEGSGFEPWTRVSNFIDSKPDSKHFMVTLNEVDEASIVFGNGNFGKIPKVFQNGIFADYRTGGGEVGNVGAQKIIVVDSPIALVSSTFNPYLPFERGEDKESVSSIKVNAPYAHRTLWGAMTVQDFADLTKLQFRETVFSSAKSTGSNITIYVLLKDGALLDESLKKEILALYDENLGGRKLVGIGTVSVEGPTYEDLTFEATLVVNDGYSRKSVEDGIREYLTDYFSVGNYDFGKDLSLTDLSASIMNPSNGIQGIKSFKFTSPSQDILTPEVNEIYRFSSISFSSSGGVE